jgi:hypothetical protein
LTKVAKGVEIPCILSLPSIDIGVENNWGLIENENFGTQEAYEDLFMSKIVANGGALRFVPPKMILLIYPFLVFHILIFFLSCNLSHKDLKIMGRVEINAPPFSN